MPFSGFQDLDPKFALALQSLIAASPSGITPFSGYRSLERQAQLWQGALAKYGSPAAARKWVAPPGQSFHGKRQAVDLRYADAEARQWAHQNAQQYGLTFPMAHEPWHIEPIGARGGAVPQQRAPQAEPQASQSGQAPGFFSPTQQQPPQQQNPYMEAIFGGQGKSDDWLQNRSYSVNALAADFFAGRNPLRRFVYQKLFG